MLKELCDHKIEIVNDRYKNHRRNFIVDQLEKILPGGITLDTFDSNAKDDKINIIAPVIKNTASNESLFLIAHYDVVDKKSDNCLDNSASIVNILHLISLIKDNPPKLMNRSLYVCFTDDEEKEGGGAVALSKRIKTDEFGKVLLAINLEWTGMGYVVTMEETELQPISSQLMLSLSAEITLMRFNDSVVLRKWGVHSVCLALGVQKNDTVFYKHLDAIHSIKDEYKLANFDDMGRFVYKLKSSIYQLL
jgi:hypothetical protein